MRPRDEVPPPWRALSVLAFLLALAGCGDTPPDEWDFLRVVVDTDLAVPDQIDSFSVTVERSGTALFDETFDQAQLQELPESLVIVNETPSNDSPEKLSTTLPFLTITVRGRKGVGVQVARSAELQFNAGQVQLPLPLCASCVGVTPPCEVGATCKGGTCADHTISSLADLPAEGEDVNALAECGAP